MSRSPFVGLGRGGRGRKARKSRDGMVLSYIIADPGDARPAGAYQKHPHTIGGGTPSVQIEGKKPPNPWAS